MVSLSDQHVLVTGAGGFIGSHLVEALVSRCRRVTALIHYDARPQWSNLEFLAPEMKKEIEAIAGDVTDAHQMRSLMRGKDTVFHLAALISIPYSYQAPETYLRTNAIGTLHVLEAARDAGVGRIVTTSTSECYGTARTVPMSEEHPLQAQSPYSASKIAADKVAESYFCSFNTPVAILRPFNTFGPRQSARAVIPAIVSQVLSEAPEVKLGSLDPVRDLTFVLDTVSGFIACAEAEGVEGEVINLGVGQGISIGELAEKIIATSGIRKPIVCEEARVRPEASEVRKLISDNSKAKRLLGWQPAFSLEQGLERTIDFVAAHPHLYHSSRYVV